MDKVYIVLDDPGCCANCTFEECMSVNLKFYKCTRTGASISKDYRQTSKLDDCPLKALPEKYETVSKDFERGYNTCIDEILETAS